MTRGDVSLDVEDNRSPYDWPHVEDLTLDRLQYSVHFPLIPQIGVWPNGEEKSISGIHTPPPEETHQVVRVLNIVVPESRILASRERCPFLVHLEVADTKLEGSDARLYAAGASNLGTTVEEALGMSSAASAAAAASQRSFSEKRSLYDIPPELLTADPRKNEQIISSKTETECKTEKAFPRGGYQMDGSVVDSEDHGGYIYSSSPFDAVREQEYEQLHQQMHIEQTIQQQPHQLEAPMDR